MDQLAAGLGRQGRRLAPLLKWPVFLRENRRDATSDGVLASSYADADLRSDRWRWWAAHVLLLAAFVATHPYFGIVHDGRLYIVQALRAADPGFLADDLYFAFGSQDAFTQFSALYAVVVTRLGASAAHFVTTVAGQAVWFGAMLLLMRTLFGIGREFVLATAAVVALSPLYGGHHVFGYGEQFATPRLYVEALAMAGVALGVNGRPLAATLCMAAGVLLHPLMALPGIAVLVLLAALRDRRILGFGAAALAILLALAVRGVEPFARALQTFDGAWFDVALPRSSFGFVTRWTWVDVADTTSKLAVLAMAWRIASASERRLLGIVGALGAIGVAATLVGADLGRNVLLTNLQPWRTMWIATLFANAWIAIVALRLPHGSAPRTVLLLAIACNVAYRLLGITDLCFPALVTIATILMFRDERDSHPVWRAFGLAAPLLAVALGGISAAILVGVLVQIGNLAVLAWPLAGAAVAAGALGLLLLTARGGGLPARRFVAAAVALVFSAVAVTDRRADWTKYINDEVVPEDLSHFMANTGRTYWEAGVEILWLKLRRPSYYSCLQGTGSMFYAATAREYQRRGAALSALGTDDFADDSDGMCAARQSAAPHVPVGGDELARACRALPDLDTVVLLRPVPGLASAVWRSPVPYTVVHDGGLRESITKFHKYRCADLR